MSGPLFRVVSAVGTRLGWPTSWSALAALVCAAAAQTVQAAPANPSPRIAFDERLSSPAVLASAVPATGKTPAIPVIARVTMERADIEPTGAAAGAGRLGAAEAAAAPAFRLDALDQRLALYASRKIPVWLALDLGARPATRLTSDEWARLIRAVAARAAGRVRVFEVIVPVADPQIVEAMALDLKRAATELRAVNPDIVVALGAEHQPGPAFVERLYTSDLRSYLDAVVVNRNDGNLVLPGPTVTRYPDGSIGGVVPGIQPMSIEWARELLDRVDKTAAVYERGRTLDGTAGAAARMFVTRELTRLGTASAIASYEAGADVVRAALTQAASVQDLLAGDLTRLDDRATQVTLTRANGQAVRHALVYDVSTFGTYLIYEADNVSANETVRVSLTIATDAKPRIRDPFGPGRNVTDFVREHDAQRTAFVAPLAAHPLIVDFNDALSDAITERNDVIGRALLSVDEIVARHQQRQAAQDAILDHYTASARMEQHFRPSVADPGYDVVTENRFYVDRDGIEWEELSFSVNGSKWKEDRPPFPILQPEKVLSVPLTLRLTDDYTYRLDGVAPVDGHDCYMVHFEPVARSTRSLYRGTIWIDTTTFVQRKLQTVQTKLSAPVVSNEETHTFSPVGSLEGREIMLSTRMVAKQIVLVAGRNLLVEKETTFTDHKVNGDDFRELRQTARASNRIMYRDTDRGVRYYVKDGPGQRIVSDRSTTSAKAIAMGTTLDPSFDFPLPIFGINYLDFDFGGPDSQLALLFGGVLALGNVQRPKLFGTGLDGSVDFFGIAVPGSDRLYDASGEHEAERVLTWPMSTGVNVGYQFTSFQKLAAQYQFRFDGYVRDRTTAEDYTLPKSTTTHGIGLAYEYRRAGYSLTANGTWYGRARWAPWGPAGALEDSAQTYEKFSVNLSKDWFVGLFHKIHANGAYFGGTRLDRFSQYQFGLFDDTRIHGVPASGVRLSELAMARGSYSFNIFEQYRFDLFLEQAYGRDRGRQADGRTDWERITGLGVAFNVKGPWNTILRVDAGKSFLPERYRTQGSTVVQVLMLKPLKGR